MKYLALLLAAAFISCGSPQKNEERTGEEGAESTTESRNGDTETVKGFTVTVPEGWDVQRNYEGTDLMVFSPTDATDDFRENFNVIVAAGAGNMPLSDYYAQSLDYFRSSAPNFELLGEGKDKIDDQEAMWFDYKFDYSGRTIYGRQYYALKNDKAFVITYSGTGSSGDPYKETFISTLKTAKLK